MRRRQKLGEWEEEQNETSITTTAPAERERERVVVSKGDKKRKRAFGKDRARKSAWTDGHNVTYSSPSIAEQKKPV